MANQVLLAVARAGRTATSATRSAARGTTKRLKALWRNEPVGLVGVGLGVCGIAVGVWFARDSRAQLNAAEMAELARSHAVEMADLERRHSADQRAANAVASALTERHADERRAADRERSALAERHATERRDSKYAAAALKDRHANERKCVKYLPKTPPEKWRAFCPNEILEEWQAAPSKGKQSQGFFQKTALWNLKERHYAEQQAAAAARKPLAQRHSAERSTAAAAMEALTQRHNAKRSTADTDATALTERHAAELREVMQRHAAERAEMTQRHTTLTMIPLAARESPPRPACEIGEILSIACPSHGVAGGAVSAAISVVYPELPATTWLARLTVHGPSTRGLPERPQGRTEAAAEPDVPAFALRQYDRGRRHLPQSLGG